MAPIKPPNAIGFTRPYLKIGTLATPAITKCVGFIIFKHLQG